MLTRNFKPLAQAFSHTLAPTNTALLTLPNNRSFCEWKPNVPKFQVRLNKATFHMAHPVWDPKDVERVEVSHRPPKDVRDWLAYKVIRTLRVSFDMISGYKHGRVNEAGYLSRILFLEVIAGVPGMIGGMLRHLRSLGSLQRDRGWIHHLLEEAENERMHLFTFLKVKQPGWLFRTGIIGAQAAFIVVYSALYLASSKMAHRFVGYLEEEAVKTYTFCIQELDEGLLPEWQKLQAPDIAKEYWALPHDASFRDMLLAVRADEVMHRELNHHLADLKADAPAEKFQVKVEEWKIEKPQKEDK